MKKVDWMIMENNRILDEQQHRTEVENEAFELMAQGKFDEARELLKFREWPGEEESENPETNVRDIRHTAEEATQAIMALTRAAAISFEPAIKIRKTARKKDIHLKVKVKGNENVSEEELKEVQKEIAVAINKANRNRNKKISYLSQLFKYSPRSKNKLHFYTCTDTFRMVSSAWYLEKRKKVKTMIGGKERVPVATAAKILGTTPLTLQESLKVNALPIGGAWKNEGSSCWTFHISPHLLAQYIGATDEELKKRIESMEVASVQQKERTE